MIHTIFPPLRFTSTPVTGVSRPCVSAPGYVCTSVDVPGGVIAAFALAIVLAGVLGAYYAYRKMKRQNSLDSVIVTYAAFMSMGAMGIVLACLAMFMPDTLGIVSTAR
jgi:putative flippase GtrA